MTGVDVFSGGDILVVLGRVVDFVHLPPVLPPPGEPRLRGEEQRLREMTTGAVVEVDEVLYATYYGTRPEVRAGDTIGVTFPLLWPGVSLEDVREVVLRSPLVRQPVLWILGDGEGRYRGDGLYFQKGFDGGILLDVDGHLVDVFAGPTFQGSFQEASQSLILSYLRERGIDTLDELAAAFRKLQSLQADR